MFFVPVGTAEEDYISVLEKRIKDYLNDSTISIEVKEFDPTFDNFTDVPDANAFYTVEDLFGITSKEYYELANTSFELEKEKLTDKSSFSDTDCITVKSYQLFIDGVRYEIGILPMDNEMINSVGHVLSKDHSTGIIIKTSSGNIPLDATLNVSEYDLTEEEIEYLKKFGYNSVSSYNLQLYSNILNKIISKFNTASEILIPFDGDNIDDLKVIYVSDDLTKTEYYDVKIVTYEGKKYLSFMTNHFSNYIVAKKDASNTDKTVVKNPDTFDNITKTVVFGGLSLIVLVSCGIYLNKKYLIKKNQLGNPSN